MTNKSLFLKVQFLLTAFCFTAAVGFSQTVDNKRPLPINQDVSGASLSSDNSRNKATQEEVDGLVQAPPVVGFSESTAIAGQPISEPVKKSTTKISTKATNKK